MIGVGPGIMPELNGTTEMYKAYLNSCEMKLCTGGKLKGKSETPRITKEKLTYL